MIEEIKKEIEPLLVLDDVLYCKDCGSRNIKKSYKPYKIGESIMKILDKYNNQEKQTTIFIDTEDMEERYGTQLYIEYLERYKKAWGELMNLYRITFKDTMSKNDYAVLYRLEELEKKHNIGNRE
jgi:hypothetical protein